MHLVNGVLQHRYRLADVVVDDGQVEEVAVRLPQHIRLLRQAFEAAVVIGNVLQQRRRDEHHVRRKLGRP